jgi:uncharacterized membrane protein YidH (DUF202 family)
MRIIGVLLIVLGIAGLAYGGLSWTTREKVIDAGPIEVSKDETKSLPIPPIAGGICVIAGIAILFSGKRR